MTRTAETKYASMNNTQTFNCSIGSPAECYAVCPAIPQGDDDWQRVGDKIRGKYLIVRGCVQYDQAVVSAQAYLPPASLRLLVLSQKNIKANGQIPSGPGVAVGSLLKPNNINAPSATSYSGGLFDNISPINTDLFKVHMDKIVKFNWQSQHTYDGSDPVVGWQVGNDRTKYFYCKIKLDRALTFDDANGNNPNTFAPFFCMGAVLDDNTTAWSLTAPFRVSYQSRLYFTDV